ERIRYPAMTPTATEARMTTTPWLPVTGPRGIGMLLTRARAAATAAAPAAPIHRCSQTVARHPAGLSGAERGPRIVASWADVAIRGPPVSVADVLAEHRGRVRPAIGPDGPFGRSGRPPCGDDPDRVGWAATVGTSGPCRRPPQPSILAVNPT